MFGHVRVSHVRCYTPIVVPMMPNLGASKTMVFQPIPSRSIAWLDKLHSWVLILVVVVDVDVVLAGFASLVVVILEEGERLHRIFSIIFVSKNESICQRCF